MHVEPLPFPLPHREGLGEKLTAALPGSLQRAAKNLFDAVLGERQNVEVCEPLVRLDLGSEAPPTLTAGILSDFHYDPLCEGDFIQRCVELVNHRRPDVLFLLGDFASTQSEPIKELAAILQNLHAPFGCYAVLGNHDFMAGAAAVQGHLETAGIQVLRNRAANIEIAGGLLPVVGLECATYGYPDLSLLADHREPPAHLVLCHEPDVFAYTSPLPKTGLQLSGHTHGGQVHLPVLGPPILPRLGTTFTRGHYRLEKAQLYVSRGIGTGHIHIRVGARPEVTILRIENVSRPEPGC